MSHVNSDSSTHSIGHSLLRVVMDMYPIPQEIKRVVRHLRDHGMTSRRYASTHIYNFWLISPLQSKYASHQSLTQVNTDLPPVTSSHPFLSDTQAASSAPQFVTIRAGQCPTDRQAYDASIKLPVLRSDRPQDTAPNYPHHRPPLSSSQFLPGQIQLAKSHVGTPTNLLLDALVLAEPHGVVRISRVWPQGRPSNDRSHISNAFSSSSCPP